MANFLSRLPSTMGDMLFGFWLIGMGLIHYFQPQAHVWLLNIAMGGLLAGSGVCTLFGR